MQNTKLIPKHQIGKKILKLLEYFGNAQIAGDSGAGAAAALASGYQYNPKTHKWEQSKENLKEAKELRNNLAVLSTSSPTHPGTALFDATVKGIGKARQYYMLKKAFTPINSTSNVLNYIIPGQIGWAPKQTVTGYHASNSKNLVPNYWFEGWAQKTHQAPYGFYVAKGSGPKSGFLKERPYVYHYSIESKNPMVQIGEVTTPYKNTTRNAIEKQAMGQGADVIIYQGIKDNQMLDQTIIKTLHPDVDIIKLPNK